MVLDVKDLITRPFYSCIHMSMLKSGTAGKEKDIASQAIFSEKMLICSYGAEQAKKQTGYNKVLFNQPATVLNCE